MAHSLWETVTRQQTLSRLSRVSPTAAAKWGRFSAPQMIAHLIDQLRVALGEQTGASVPGFWRTRPGRWLALYVAPMPRGKLAAPSVLLSSLPGNWAEDMQTLVELIEQCAARKADATWGESPVFGALSRDEWGRLAYKHFDHHLRQFGV